MPEDDAAENAIVNAAPGRSTRRGDIPDAIRQRYLTDERGGPGLGFYIDATIIRPAFRDQGYRLDFERADPKAIRDACEIARHRGWSIVTVRGSAEFRREAWLVGMGLGLEVQGYQPTERDLQDLERRTRQPDRSSDTRVEKAAPSQLRAIDDLVKERISDAEARRRIMASARIRIADWLERGARFEPPRRERVSASERQRAR